MKHNILPLIVMTGLILNGDYATAAPDKTIQRRQVDNLSWGHWMTSDIYLDPSGHVDATTVTEARLPFCGWTGGVKIIPVGADGRALGQTGIEKFGCDAWPFGPGKRTDYWSREVGRPIGQGATSFEIVHAWAPTSKLGTWIDFVKNLGVKVLDVLPILKAIGKVAG